MLNFYPVEDFQAQLQEFLALGMSKDQAYRKVVENEQADLDEYERWLDSAVEEFIA